MTLLIAEQAGCGDVLLAVQAAITSRQQMLGCAPTLHQLCCRQSVDVRKPRGALSPHWFSAVIATT